MSVPNETEKSSTDNNNFRKSFKTSLVLPKRLDPHYLNQKFSTTMEAIAWISSTPKSNFEISKEFTHISLNISEKIEKSLFDNFLKSFFGIEYSILIYVKSSAVEDESLFYWRNLGKKVFHYLEINNDSNGFVTQFCQKFLLNEILTFKSGK